MQLLSSVKTEIYSLNLIKKTEYTKGSNTETDHKFLNKTRENEFRGVNEKRRANWNTHSQIFSPWFSTRLRFVTCNYIRF